jgi:hypothetical protein
VLQEARAGELHSADFTPAFWQMLGPAQQQLRPELEKLGKLLTVRLIERTPTSRLYLEEFQKATVLQRIEVDALNRIALFKSEAAEMKIRTVRVK